MRNLFVGAAGSALILAIDLWITHWSNNNIPGRIGFAVAAFILFYIASAVIPWKSAASGTKRILSGIRSKGSTEIDADSIESPDANRILTGIKSEKDTKIKVKEIKS